MSIDMECIRGHSNASQRERGHRGKYSVDKVRIVKIPWRLRRCLRRFSYSGLETRGEVTEAGDAGAARVIET